MPEDKPQKVIVTNSVPVHGDVGTGCLPFILVCGLLWIVSMLDNIVSVLHIIADKL